MTSELKVFDATTDDGAATLRQLNAGLVSVAGLQRVSVTFTKADIQAGGAALSHTFSLSGPFLSGATVTGVEIEVTTAVTGVALASSSATIGLVGEATDCLMKSVSLTTTGLKTALGSNPHPSIGGETITCTITNVGLNLAGITNGGFVINLFLAIIP